MNKQHLFSAVANRVSLVFCLLSLALIFSGCSTVRLQLQEITKEQSKLPREMKFAEEDFRIQKETSCIITVNDDTGVFLIGKDQLGKDQLAERVKELMSDKSPDERIVYLKSTENVKYQTIIEVLNSIRRADIDKIGLIVLRENEEKPGARPHMLEVKLPEGENDSKILKPDPLVLVAMIDRTKNLRLNNEQMGSAGEQTALTNKLVQVFKDRENNGIFREGTNEVEKTVIVKAARSLTYGDVVKLINAVKGAGAAPIGLQIDDLTD
jgi:biopolymer transport protein ExbD